jgi:hypothetical protein
MGPAGLPLEISSLVKIISKFNKTISESEIIQFLQDVLGIKLPSSLQNLEMDGMDICNFSTEIKKARKTMPESNVNLYPGFEAVDFPPICSMDEKTLIMYMNEILKNNLNGFVLSWDISRIPENHLNLVGDLIEKNK